MIVFRVLRVVMHLCSGMFTCAFVFPLTDAQGRLWRIKDWSGRLLAICGVRIAVSDEHGSAAPRHAMIVANHVSWLDIFVINAMQPCRFVAKSDIRDWPLLGWLSAKAGTVFIARGNRRDVRRIFTDLVASIHAGERVAFFPEGTTCRQGHLLPFHANLFEAAINAQVPVQPYALRYTDATGAYHPAVDFVGDMNFAQSILAILRTGNITAHIALLPVIETAGGHRRDLASAAHQSVAQALGLPLSPACRPAGIEDNPPAASAGLQGVLP